MKYFTTLLSFILLIHLSDLSAQRSSGKKSGRKVVTTDSTATKTDTTATKNKSGKIRSGRTSREQKDSDKQSVSSARSSSPSKKKREVRSNKKSSDGGLRIVSTANVHGETDP